jgi:hypothetical protein
MHSMTPGMWLKGLPGRNFNPTRSNPTAKHATSSVVVYLTCLLQALRAIAPENDWDWIADAIKLLKHTVMPVRDKRPRLQPIGELFAKEIELMVAADSAGESHYLTEFLWPVSFTPEQLSMAVRTRVYSAIFRSVGTASDAGM